MEKKEPLSKREEIIWQALAEGKLYKEIAEDKAISINTVKKHLKSIYRKLDVSSRKEAIHMYTDLNSGMPGSVKVG